MDLGVKGEHLGRLTYGQEVFYAVYNLVTVSQNLKLLAVPGDKYSREKLEKTRDKLMEFREASNILDKTRVDSGAKKTLESANRLMGMVGSGWTAQEIHSLSQTRYFLELLCV